MQKIEAARPSRYRLIAGVSADNLKWASLALNPSPGAMELLATRPDEIRWDILPRNKGVAAAEMLRANPEKVCVDGLYMFDGPRPINATPEELARMRLSRNASPAAGAYLKANPHMIDWAELSANPSDAALDLLEASPGNINWSGLSRNVSVRALAMLQDQAFMAEHGGEIDWDSLAMCRARGAMQLLARSAPAWMRQRRLVLWRLCTNPRPEAADIIVDHIEDMDLFNWQNIYQNYNVEGAWSLKIARALWAHPRIKQTPCPDIPGQLYPEAYIMRAVSADPSPEALAELEARPDKIDWDGLLANPSPRALPLIRALMAANVERTNLLALCQSRTSIAMLLVADAISDLDRRSGGVDWSWRYLSANPNPQAIELLCRNPSRINWAWMASNTNPQAVAMVLAWPPHSVDWRNLSENPAIFEYNYAAMRAHMDLLREDLARAVYHPRRLARWLATADSPDGGGEWLA